MQLSIVVPIYGVESLLPRCLESIFAQTFHDYELILVDDFAFRPLRWAVYRQLRLMAGRIKRALLPSRRAAT